MVRKIKMLTDLETHCWHLTDIQVVLFFFTVKSMFISLFLNVLLHLCSSVTRADSFTVSHFLNSL